MDKGMPGMDASYEKSGLLAQQAVDQVTSPSLWWEAPRYLIKKNNPLFMKWGYLPKMLPWLTIFITHANHADTKRIVKSLVPILSDAIDQHRSLVNGTSLEKQILDSNFSWPLPLPKNIRTPAPKSIENRALIAPSAVSSTSAQTQMSVDKKRPSEGLNIITEMAPKLRIFTNKIPRGAKPRNISRLTMRSLLESNCYII